jgi:hypothetical protein
MTAGHVHDELPALLRGEADRPTVAGAAAHLRGCEDCCQELVSALVAHASLASAARFAPDLMAPRHTDTDLSGASDDDPPAAEQGPLPDFGPVLARAREADRQRGRRLVGARWVAAAAVLGIAVGVGGVVATDHLRAPASRTVALAAFGKGTVPATAEIVGGTQLRLRAGALPAPGADRLYEVWLTNDARTRMYAVGSLPAGRTGTFTVAPTLLHRYTAIEVSVQPLNNSSYSGTSVLRGHYG